MNLFHGRLEDGHLRINGRPGTTHASAEPNGPAGVAYVRPHDVEVERTNGNGDAIQARVEQVNFAGPFVYPPAPTTATASPSKPPSRASAFENSTSAAGRSLSDVEKRPSLHRRLFNLKQFSRC